MQLRQIFPMLVSATVLISAHVYANDEITVELPGGARMEMVWITPGEFLMGFPGSEGGDLELTRLHGVTISKGFYLGKFEVTQGQWESVMENQPWLGNDNVMLEPFSPAVFISWGETQEFIHRLNQAEGDSLYRLPTEAEWEYACRAGSMTRWSFGDGEGELENYAWYDVNAWSMGLHAAQPVGNLLPNSWGLFDMHGNVLEWVQDWWGDYPSDDVVDPAGPETGDLRVVRGGGFDMDSRSNRSGSRFGGTPVYTDYNVGVRLVWVAPEATAVTPQGWGTIKQGR